MSIKLRAESQGSPLKLFSHQNNLLLNNVKWKLVQNTLSLQFASVLAHISPKINTQET